MFTGTWEGFLFFVGRTAGWTLLSDGKVLRRGISTQAFLDFRNLHASTEILRKFLDGAAKLYHSLDS